MKWYLVCKICVFFVMFIVILWYIKISYIIYVKGLIEVFSCISVNYCIVVGELCGIVYNLFDKVFFGKVFVVCCVWI